MPSEKESMPPAPIPYLPQDPNRVTSNDVERMIESRISLFWRAQQEGIKDSKKKALYKNIAFGVAGFVVGVGGSMIVGRIRSGRAVAAMPAKPNLVAMK